jgi:small subunit ribosomal protein S15e
VPKKRGGEEKKEALDDSLVPASSQPHEQTGPKPYKHPPSSFAHFPHPIVRKLPNNKPWCIIGYTRFEFRIADTISRIFSAIPLTTTAPPIASQADADVTDPVLAAELKKKRTFRTFSYRGVELEKLLDMSNDDFVELVHARARRRFQRGLKRKPMGLIKKLRKAKKEAPPNEKPAVVKTHLRDMIIVPEMIGSVIGIYNGKVCEG